MAMDSRPESLLPTIKCSTCAQEIDLMSLADHVCNTLSKSSAQKYRAPDPDLPNPGFGCTNQSDHLPLQDPAIQAAAAGRAPQAFLGYLRPGRNVPPRIDAVAANQPFLSMADSSTPISDCSKYSDGQTATPLTTDTKIVTSSSMSSRKPSPSSRKLSPPSPHLASNLSSAFPPITAVANPYQEARSNSPMDMYAPLSPRPYGGSEVVQRMNGIAPGPFAGGQRVRHDRYPTANPQPQGSRSPSGSFQQQFRNEQGRQHFRKFSNASSVRSQQSMGSQVYHRREGSAASNRMRPSEAIDKFLDELQSQPSLSPTKSPESAKSRTFPEDRHLPRKPKFIGAGILPPPSAPLYQTPFPQRQAIEEKRPGTSPGGMSSGFGGFSALNDPAVQKLPEQRPIYNSSGLENLPQNSRRSRSRTITQNSGPSPVPEVAQFEQPRPSPLPPAGNKPLPDILRAGSRERIPLPPSGSSVFDAPRSRSRTITRPSETTNKLRPPMPTFPAFPTFTKAKTGEHDLSNMYHSPSDSISSGYASTGRSTPPSSVGSMMSRSGSTDSGDERYWDGGAPKTPIFPESSNIADDYYNQPESPVDPAVQRGRLPMYPTGQYGSREMTKGSPPKRGPPPTMQSFQGPSPAFNKPAASKGNCAACQLPIYGKSVKAAGGKLTGRYHKECFSCKTCQAPFPTAEFYVLNNAPYCARHYHELNGSLCRKCDMGIEGQYLQTDRQEKYHAHCFSCTECRVRLTEDYYEVHGRYFCERHAFSMMRNRGPQYGGNNLGVQGSNRPEKRRTRLMMI